MTYCWYAYTITRGTRVKKKNFINGQRIFFFYKTFKFEKHKYIYVRNIYILQTMTIVNYGNRITDDINLEVYDYDTHNYYGSSVQTRIMDIFG